MVEIRLGRVVLRVNIAVTGVLILAVNFHMTVEAREVEKELARTFMRVLLGLSGMRRCYRCKHIKKKKGSLTMILASAQLLSFYSLFSLPSFFF